MRFPLAIRIIDGMAASILASGNRPISPSRRRPAVSLVELLVVLFIMGIMLSLLLPALSGARNKAENTRCMNNLRNLQLALRQAINANKRFPLPNRWTVDLLPWIEERELHSALKNNFDPNARFPRPAVMVCPFQEEFPSRVQDVGFCHYILTVDRPIKGPPDKVRWQLHDRQQLSSDVVEQPWYIAPEQTFEQQAILFAQQPGPHEEGKFMTAAGQLVP